MEKMGRLRVLGTVLAAAGALVLSGVPATAALSHPHKPMAYTCTGGDIPSGKYASITVTGACTVPADAVIRVVRNVKVVPGAILDAQSAPSTIRVGRNVTAAAGALVGLGCQPDYSDRSGHPCTVEPDGHSTITVKGSVMAFHADTVLLNGITVRQNVRLFGGGGDIPWSIKNNTIGGNLKSIGQKPEWLGVLFNSIGGDVKLFHITLHDVDPGAPGVYVVRNTIARNLVCWKLNPGVSGGFIPGEVNVVGGHAIGQCASLV
jgi:hypothetical protein